ncbi:hypothetical protein FQN50_005671 [Emmonsiellopsis sp. PD_5]|nr:hypothetical protein FQN50_005671 [Emmonsiellopsis sp. PD_5]
MSAPAPNPNAPLSGAARTVDRDALLAIIWVCFTTATCFLSLRLVVRWRQNRRLLADDYWMLWAWLCMCTMAILQTQQMDALFFMTHLAAGRIAADPQDIVAHSRQLTRWQFPIIKLFWTTLWSVKAGFLSLFFRLIQSFPILRRLWYALAVFAALSFIGCVLASTLTCNPPSDYFYGNCDSPHETWMQSFNVIFSTSVDISTDIMIMALPIAALPSLQLDRRKKVGLGIIFGLGFIIICVAVVRMTQVVRGGAVDLVGLAIWGAVETATAIVVGCLPPLKSLVSRGLKKYQTTRKSSSNRQRRNYYGHSNSHHTTTTNLNPADPYVADGIQSHPAVVSESIPLDSWHRSGHTDGAIYVQKMFTTTVTKADS